MRKVLFFSCMVILAGITSCSRKVISPALRIPDSIPTIMIHKGSSGLGPCEPTICIDPTDPSLVVAGSVLDNVYVSEDGGKSWQLDRLESSLQVFGDPVIRIDHTGMIYYAHLSNPGGGAYRSESFLDRIVVQRSSDRGKTWNDGSYSKVRGKKDQDKHWLTIDPNDHTVLMTWTEFDKYGSPDPKDKSRILFSKSTDQGLSWTDPVAISEKEGNCIDDDETTEGATTAIGINGDYYAAWAYNEKIYFDFSKDMGITWEEKDRIIADQVNGWSLDIPGLNRCNGMPFLKSDYSNGPFRGRLYLNWSDQRNGEDNTDIWIKYSDDGGLNWSDAIRVNDDDSGNHQFLSNMDVDPATGVVYIVFYDRRAHSDNNTDVYIAYSQDGGKSFTNLKISESPFEPDKQVFFGDYNDISAYDNKIRPIWTRNEGRSLSIWTALIDMQVQR
jgi:hypothetical protein